MVSFRFHRKMQAGAACLSLLLSTYSIRQSMKIGDLEWASAKENLGLTTLPEWNIFLDAKQTKENLRSLTVPEWCNFLDPEITKKTLKQLLLPHGLVQVYRIGKNTAGIIVSMKKGLSPESANDEFGHKTWMKIAYPNISLNYTRDNWSKVPAFENFLGCSSIDQKPNGTVILTIQNFGCQNIWHALANQQGLMQLLHAASVHPLEVDWVVYANDFLNGHLNDQQNSTRLHKLLLPLFSAKPKMAAPESKNCFERILWIETMGYRPGVLWELFQKDPSQCYPQQSLFVSMQSYQEESRNVVGIVGATPSHLGQKVHLCYMSRQLAGKGNNWTGGTRYFSDEFAPLFENAIDAWVSKHSDNVTFDRMVFGDGVSLFEQAKRASKCNVLFGPHGAGLTHMWWMPGNLSTMQLLSGGNYTISGTGKLSHVIEFGGTLPEHKQCLTFYHYMAEWLGHGYSCFSSLENAGVNMDPKSRKFKELNVPLFLALLEKVTYSISVLV